MMSNRLFDTPHRALRYLLGKFSYHLGYLDALNPLQLLQLKSIGIEMFTLLDSHVETENEYILPIIESLIKGSGDHDRHDHESLELKQNALRAQLNNLTGSESTEELHIFYLNFSVFHSEYLAHIFEEETVTEVFFHQHFNDNELEQIKLGVMPRLKIEVAMLWMKYIIPTQNEVFNLELMKRLRLHFTKEEFNQLAVNIGEEMDSTRLEKILNQAG